MANKYGITIEDTDDGRVNISFGALTPESVDPLVTSPADYTPAVALTIKMLEFIQVNQAPKEVEEDD